MIELPLENQAVRDLPGIGRVYGFAGDALIWQRGATRWVLIADGPCAVQAPQGQFVLAAGMFAVLPDCGQLSGGRGLLIETAETLGVFQIGGPPEQLGRLRYIDGCTDSLLVCPPRLGLPCLNHLHLPSHTRQSHHSHPSDRVGIIARGRGRACMDDHRIELHAGMGWWIPARTAHHFETDGDTLDVLAWHPDSDFGPTDQAHPMVNRTLLSAQGPRSEPPTGAQPLGACRSIPTRS